MNTFVREEVLLVSHDNLTVQHLNQEQEENLI